MAKHLLTNVSAKAITKHGRHADGAGLYLAVDGYGKRWVLLFTMGGKRREMGLGPFPAVSLAAARLKADEARAAVLEGKDPIAVRKAPASTAPTFATFSRGLIADLSPGWSGAKTEEGWTRSLLTHAAALADRPLDSITTEDVLEVVKGYWIEKPESGQQLRARIERVLDAAKAKNLRSGENPARWRGHLSELLSKPQKLVRGHHRSIPWKDAPAFMKDLAKRQGMGARALEWTIYHAAREGMTINAVWAHLPEPAAGDWHVPAHLMKSRRAFVAPITVQARRVLTHCDISTPFVFPGQRISRGLSNATMDKLLDDMGVDATPHGFRTTFRDWAGDCTDHPREVAEAALDHVVGNATERAYRRGDALEKRRLLATDWADFLSPR